MILLGGFCYGWLQKQGDFSEILSLKGLQSVVLDVFERAKFAGPGADAF